MSDIMEAVREAGYQEGLKVGKARGKTKTACQVVLKMIADGYTDEKIQLYTDLFTDEINRLRQSPGNMEL